MNAHFHLVTFIALLAFGSIAAASNPTISVSSLSASIEQPVISAIYRDAQGLLWIGTQEGLYRFDGSGFTSFNSDGSNRNWISNSDVRGITETLDGDLIVATYGGGLWRLDRRTSTFQRVRFPRADTTSHLTNIFVSSNGNVWLGTKEELLLCDKDLQTITTWQDKNDASNTIGRPFVFTESEPGILLVGSSKGLTEISLNDRTSFSYDLSVLGENASRGVTALEVTHDGSVFIGTDSGHLARISTKSRSLIDRGKLGSDQSLLITDFSIDEERILIATDRGLYYTDGLLSSARNISANGSGLSNTDIYTLYQNGKYTYIGTYNGLNVLSYSPFEIFNSNNSSLYNDVLAFEQDMQGTLWVGTYDGLYSQNQATGDFERFIPSGRSKRIKDQRITAITSSEDHLWIGFFQGGVQAVSLLTEEIVTLNIMNSPDLFVTDIHAQMNSRNVWIATYSHGLIKVDPTGVHYYLDGTELPERRILVIHELNDGDILFSTKDKLYRYNHHKSRISDIAINFGLGLSKPEILSIEEDRNGTIWFGTKDNGLFSIDRAALSKTTFQLEQAVNSDALKYSTIYGVEIDILNNIWCSTQNGIVKLDPDGKLIKRFTTADGLQGNDFNLGASFTSKEGLIYFGGVNGYNRFDPAEVEIERAVSPMKLTNVFFPGNDGRDLPNLSDITDVHLTHEDRSVTFQFSVLDFIHPEKNQFRYMLQNFDSNWVENGPRNTATYTNLPSGNYVLRVQGSNSAGIWNRNGITLDIHVAPPPWFSWWAICTYVMTLLFLTWCGLRIYRSYVLDRYAKAIEMEMIEADNRADDEFQEQIELQDEIIQSSYEHNIATLALVSDSISLQANRTAAQGELANSSIKRLKALTHLEECLYFQDGETAVNLKKFTDITISEMLQKTPVDPQTIITINEVSSRLIPTAIASPAAVVLYELLENCFLHAFEGDSLANYVHVKLEGVEDREKFTFAAQLFVGDSGVGLPVDPAELVCGSSGIGVAHAIVSESGGTLEFADGDGTKITITFPTPDPI